MPVRTSAARPAAGVRRSRIAVLALFAACGITVGSWASRVPAVLRQVGTVMSRYGGGVPWHRVVNASGRVVPGHEQEALRRLRAEGTPLRGDRVDIRLAAWWPDR